MEYTASYYSLRFAGRDYGYVLIASPTGIVYDDRGVCQFPVADVEEARRVAAKWEATPANF